MNKDKCFWTIKDILFGFLLALGCYLIQHSSGLISSLAKYPLQIQTMKNEGTDLMMDISGLPQGKYYVSVGGPKVPCDLFVDERKLDSNKSEVSGLRNGLFLGGGFLVMPNQRNDKVTIKCEDQSGFIGLTHEPVIANYFWGTLLQLWRAVTELLLGPISSLLIIISFVFRSSKRERLGVRKNTSALEGWKYLFFGIVSLCYSLSLALVTRLFLTGMSATILHVFFRNIFSLAVLLLFSSLGNKNKFLIFAQVFLIILVPVWGVVRPESFVLFYRWQYSFFPFASALIAFEMFNVKPKSKSIVVLRRILLAWTLVQILDLLANWTDVGIYTAPSVVFLLCVSAFILRNLERVKALSIESAVTNILSAVESEKSIELVLKKMALLTMQEAHYGRVSSYVDGFCIGTMDSPGKSFFRVNETGYKKDTSVDSVINFSEGRGQIMAEALRTHQPLLRTGLTDGAWFLVVPIGTHACINLSDDQPKSDFLAYESLEIIQRILPSLMSLERRLIDLGFLQGAALQRLRSLRGDGSWEEELGSIFVDINDYSRLSDTFGDPFTTFVSKVYIPSFIKAVSKFAVSEHVAGDEIYFIVTKDLLADGVTLREAVVETIEAIDNFVYNEGAVLCVASGFSPMTASVGVNVGIGSIVCDSVSVRTAGKLVNHAKRLQEEAGKGGILIGAESDLDLTSSQFKLGEEILIQKKKQVVLGNRILRKGFFQKAK